MSGAAGFWWEVIKFVVPILSTIIIVALGHWFNSKQLKESNSKEFERLQLTFQNDAKAKKQELYFKTLQELVVIIHAWRHAFSEAYFKYAKLNVYRNSPMTIADFPLATKLTSDNQLYLHQWKVVQKMLFDEHKESYENIFSIVDKIYKIETDHFEVWVENNDLYFDDDTMKELKSLLSKLTMKIDDYVELVAQHAKNL